MVLWFAREAHDTMVRTWIDVHQRICLRTQTHSRLCTVYLARHVTSKDMIDRLADTGTDNSAFPRADATDALIFIILSFI